MRISQEPSFVILCKKDQKEGTSQPSSHTGVNISSLFSHKAVVSHRISSEQHFSEALDHKDLKDDENKTVIRIIDDIAGCCKDLPTFKKLCKALSHVAKI